MAPLGFGLWRLSRAGTGEPGGLRDGPIGAAPGAFAVLRGKGRNFFCIVQAFLVFFAFFLCFERVFRAQSGYLVCT